MKADHIVPVVDPAVGFTTWDEFIDRMFVEKEDFQAVCGGCHAIKTAEERAIRTQRNRDLKAEATKPFRKRTRKNVAVRKRVRRNLQN